MDFPILRMYKWIKIQSVPKVFEHFKKFATRIL